MINKTKDTIEKNFLFSLHCDRREHTLHTLSFFPLARSCEQSELDVYRDFHPEGWFSKAVRGLYLASILY
jgi:hypothetical protein